MRCINCSLRLRYLRKHCLAEENDQILERVRKCVHPRDISSEDYLCHECWKLIHQNNDQPFVGHRNVCIACGKSVYRLAYRIILKVEMSEMDTFIAEVITEWVQRPIQPSEKICRACYARAKRELSSRHKSDSEVDIKPDPLFIQESHELIEQDQSIEQNQSVSQQSAPKRNAIGLEILLPTVRRAANTAHRCLFTKCDDRKRKTMPESIRRMVLKEYNFYIPIQSRICEYHLGSNMFHDLYAAENAMSTFTAEQIEDMLYLLREHKRINFRYPETIDDHLFRHWFGRTKSEYNEIIAQVPNINNSKMKLGLVALLYKTRTGDSNEKISALFQIPRSTLERYIHQVNEILVQENVSLDFKMNHVTRQEISSK